MKKDHMYGKYPDAKTADLDTNKCLFEPNSSLFELYDVSPMT